MKYGLDAVVSSNDTYVKMRLFSQRAESCNGWTSASETCLSLVSGADRKSVWRTATIMNDEQKWSGPDFRGLRRRPPREFAHDGNPHF